MPIPVTGAKLRGKKPMRFRAVRRGESAWGKPSVVGVIFQSLPTEAGRPNVQTMSFGWLPLPGELSAKLTEE